MQACELQARGWGLTTGVGWPVRPCDEAAGQPAAGAPARCWLPPSGPRGICAGASVTQRHLARHGRGVGRALRASLLCPTPHPPLSQGRCPMGSGLPPPWPALLCPHSCSPKFLDLTPPWSLPLRTCAEGHADSGHRQRPARLLALGIQMRAPQLGWGRRGQRRPGTDEERAGWPGRGLPSGTAWPPGRRCRAGGWQVSRSGEGARGEAARTWAPRGPVLGGRCLRVGVGSRQPVPGDPWGQAGQLAWFQGPGLAPGVASGVRGPRDGQLEEERPGTRPEGGPVRGVRGQQPRIQRPGSGPLPRRRETGRP